MIGSRLSLLAIGAPKMAAATDVPVRVCNQEIVKLDLEIKAAVQVEPPLLLFPVRAANDMRPAVPLSSQLDSRSSFKFRSHVPFSCCLFGRLLYWTLSKCWCPTMRSTAAPLGIGRTEEVLPPLLRPAEGSSTEVGGLLLPTHSLGVLVW